MASQKLYHSATNMVTGSCADLTCDYKAVGTLKAVTMKINMHVKLKHPHITSTIVVNDDTPSKVMQKKGASIEVNKNREKYNEEAFEKRREKILSLKKMLCN